MKKLVAIMLTCLAFMQAVAYDFKSGDLYYNITSSTEPYTVEVTAEGLDDDNYSELTVAEIPSSVNNNDIDYAVVSIGAGAFKYCSKLTSVSIPNSVTSIGSWAFTCHLVSIEIPSTVTEIGEYAFNTIFNVIYNGTATGSPWGATAVNGTIDGDFLYADVEKTRLLKYIGNGSDVVIPNTVTYIGNAFQHCDGLTSVSIPTSVVEISNSAFYGCYNLTYTEYENAKYLGNSDNPYLWLIKAETYITECTINERTVGIANNAFYSCSYLTSISIPNSVVYAGEGAFMWCDGLQSVTIGNSVNAIAESMFYYCSGLTSVVIPNSVTSISRSAFYGCSGLTSVAIPKSVVSLGESAFGWCSSLDRVDYQGAIEDWLKIPYNNVNAYPFQYPYHLYIDNQEVTDVTVPATITRIPVLAFYNCTGLKSVSIGNSVTEIGDYSFYNCEGLKTVSVGNSVTRIGGYAFYNCAGVTSVTIPSSVTEIGSNAFYNIVNVNYNGDATGSPWGAKTVNGIVEGDFIYADAEKTILSAYIGNGGDVVIPNSVKTIGNHAFDNCSGLTSVTIPNSVTSIGSYAFQNCSGLASVSIPNSVTNIGPFAFAGCSGLTSITIPDLVTIIGDYAFDGCSGLTSITIPNSVTSIGNFAFYGCSGLTSVAIPNSVTSIGERAFLGCSGLTSVIIPNSVASIGANAFDYCDKLSYYEDDEAYYLGNDESPYLWLVKAKNTYIASYDINAECKGIFSGAFSNCGKLASITIPNSVTSIGESAFYYCRSLTSVVIPNSVTSIGGYAFCGCSGLTSVSIPNSVTSIGLSVFDYCDNLKYNEFDNALYLGNDDNPYLWLMKAKSYDITSCAISDKTVNIACQAFSYSKLVSVTIPNSVVAIDVYAFRGCADLTSVVIGNKVEHIGHYVFEGCNSLTSINIPSSVSFIGVCAFNGCTSLPSITIPKSVSYVGFSAFYGCDSLTINCEASEKPMEWDFSWNPDDRPVVWAGANEKENDGDEKDKEGDEKDKEGDEKDKEGDEKDKEGCIEEELASNIVIYAHHNVIVVENATEEISVYDAVGRIVCKNSVCDSRAELQINKQGLYIVKVGNVAKRVVIK